MPKPTKRVAGRRSRGSLNKRLVEGPSRRRHASKETLLHFTPTLQLGENEVGSVSPGKARPEGSRAADGFESEPDWLRSNRRARRVGSLETRANPYWPTIRSAHCFWTGEYGRPCCWSGRPCNRRNPLAQSCWVCWALGSILVHGSINFNSLIRGTFPMAVYLSGAASKVTSSSSRCPPRRILIFWG
jgi:hypothetical protein